MFKLRNALTQNPTFHTRTMFSIGEWPDLTYWEPRLSTIDLQTTCMLIMALHEHKPVLKGAIRGRSMCLNFPKEDGFVIAWKSRLEVRIPQLLERLEERYNVLFPAVVEIPDDRS